MIAGRPGSAALLLLGLGGAAALQRELVLSGLGEHDGERFVVVRTGPARGVPAVEAARRGRRD